MPTIAYSGLTAKVDENNNTVVKVGAGGTVKFQWADGVDAELLRGATDTDRTAIALRRSDGTKIYLYVDTGTTLVVSATAP